MAADVTANIGIRVYLDDAASRGLYAINQQLASMSSLVLGAGLAFAAFSGGLVYAIVQGAGIAMAMTQIGLATGMTKNQLAQLQPFLLNIGGSSIFSIQQLAAGMALLGQYSYKTVPAIEAVSAAGVKLAEATGSTPVEAFKLLAVAMQAFNLPASQANYVASLLFYSFEHGTPNIAQMTTALGQLGGAADFLHIPLSQLIPALDIVTIGVGSASTAAAGLRFFLNNVEGSSKTARAAFAALGMSAFDAKGNFIGLPALLGEIGDKLKGLSTQDQYKVITELFNIRSGTAIKQLITQLESYNARLKDTNNATKLQHDLDAAVAQVMGNVGSVLKEVGSNFADFAGEVGLQVLPALIAFLQQAILPLVTGLRLLASNPALAQAIAMFLVLGTVLSGAVLTVAALVAIVTSGVGVALLFAGGFALLAAVITGVIGNWNNFVALMVRLKPVLEAVGIALLTIAGIFAAIAITPFLVDMATLATLAILVAAGYTTAAIPAIASWIASMAVATARGIAYVAMNLTTLIPSLLAQAAAYTMAGIRIAAAAAIKFAMEIPALLASAAAWAMNAAMMLLALAPYILIGAAVVGAVIGLGLLIQKLGGLKVFLDIARAAWAAILPAIQQAGSAIRDAFVAALRQLEPLWTQLVAAFNQAKPILIFLGAVLGTIIVAAIAILIGIIRMLISVFANVLVTVIQVVAHVIQVFTGLVQFFTGLFKIIFGIFTLNGNMIKQGWDLLWHGILNIVQGIAGSIWAVFTGFFRTVLGGIQNFINGIINFFVGLFNRLVGHSLIPDMANMIVNVFFGLPARVIGALINLGGMLWNTFTNAMHRALDAIGQKANDLLSFMRGLPGKIVNAVGNLGNLLWNAGASIINGLWNGAKSVIGGLFNWFGQQLGNLRNMFPHSPVKEGPLVGYETWIPTMIRTMVRSADQEGPSLKASMGRVAQGVASGFSSTVPAGMGGAGQTQFIITLDGKVLFDSMQTRMRNALQAQGMSRMLR